MRLFVALPLPDAAVDALEPVAADLRFGRLVPPENYHVTLAFLGDLSGATAEAVHGALSDIRGEPVEIELRGADVFGGKKPRLAFAAVRGGAPLERLQASVVRAVQTVGVATERRRFRPHVTLSRVNGRLRGDEVDKLGAWLARHGAFAAGPFVVRQFALYRSTLTPDGAIYDALAVYPLG